MIVSASRRTDFCAFFAEQFHKDFKRGFTLLVNPFNRRQVRRVSLKREDVDCFVFWTRWPLPFFGNFQCLQEEGVPFYILLTYNGYPPPLEVGLPSLKDLLSALEKFKKFFFSTPIFWRYDPIVVSRDFNPNYHYQNFRRLIAALAPFISGVIVSFLDFYPKVVRRLKNVAFFSTLLELNGDEQNDIASILHEIAGEFRLNLQTCARDNSKFPGKCISDRVVSALSKKMIIYKKDSAQRPFCLCQQSVDIGQYVTCRFNCIYCYAR